MPKNRLPKSNKMTKNTIKYLKMTKNDQFSTNTPISPKETLNFQKYDKIDKITANTTKCNLKIDKMT